VVQYLAVKTEVFLAFGTKKPRAFRVRRLVLPGFLGWFSESCLHASLGIRGFN
jgi:hypothetical protein